MLDYGHIWHVSAHGLYSYVVCEHTAACLINSHLHVDLYLIMHFKIELKAAHKGKEHVNTRKIASNQKP